MFRSDKLGQLRKLFCPCCGGSTRTRGLKPETVRVEPRVSYHRLALTPDPSTEAAQDVPWVRFVKLAFANRAFTLPHIETSLRAEDLVRSA